MYIARHGQERRREEVEQESEYAYFMVGLLHEPWQPQGLINQELERPEALRLTRGQEAA